MSRNVTSVLAASSGAWWVRPVKNLAAAASNCRTRPTGHIVTGFYDPLFG